LIAEQAEQQLKTFAAALWEVGFEILQEPEKQNVYKIKRLVIPRA
jgi:hypothetical protein